MATSPPRRARHLQVFGLSLLVIVLLLVAFLFGARMEALAPATGVVTARDLYEVRARRTGLVEFGPQRLRPGDVVRPGQTLATLRVEANGTESEAALKAPDSAEAWLVVEVSATPGQAVPAGGLVATLVPCDPQTHRPLGLEVRLDIDEKHHGAVQPGQEVRLYSTMYNHRIHGTATARIERLEPLGSAAPGGGRRFHAVAEVTDAPFDLRLGSSVRAEVLLGLKRTYQIILEH